MTHNDFAAVITYLGEGTGKPLSLPAAEVYWDLLSDLPLAALRVAAKQALLEGQYPVFPPAGVLRRLAVEALMYGRGDPAPEEAWALVRRALSEFGYYREAAGLASLPGLVRRAAELLGWQSMCDSTEPEILRAQFRKVYEGGHRRAGVGVGAARPSRAGLRLKEREGPGRFWHHAPSPGKHAGAIVGA
jgi:hypothetical protein